MAVNDGDILRVTARLNNALTGDMANVFNVRVEGTGGLVDVVAVDECAAYMEEIYGGLVPRMSDDWEFQDVNVFDITQDRPVGIGTWPTLIDGDSTAAALPSQLTAFVRGLTGLSRSWARKFFGGFTEDGNTGDGFIENLVVTALVNAVAAWIAGHAVTGGGLLQPVVYHGKTTTWEDVIEGVVTNIWSTYRTRRAGRGS